MIKKKVDYFKIEKINYPIIMTTVNNEHIIMINKGEGFMLPSKEYPNGCYSKQWDMEAFIKLHGSILLINT